ncbi:outer membrane protein assembly factor [Prolixibacter bellariivorans]|uniref:Outer membrane protein assembly factor BamA n=1 Tax=Prolixibacter bellariivorans TaxID=314319 RepID=A0A5M4AWF5_9BACT|nr:outer membrane protein assembly factor BamA [Prolixibacter bellariivorans]GET31777.1 outer membrane protein assembly factor [Prolixibacter bellariivorans]
MYKKLILFFLLIFSSSAGVFAQVVADSTNFSIYYDSQKMYTIGGIEISGIRFLDKEVLKKLSGLQVGDEVSVPGDKITAAIKKYWRQGLFSDVKITATKIVGNKIWLNIYLQERPRLSQVNYNGVTKGEKDEIEKKVLLIIGGQVTDNLINNAQRQILNYYHGKGFFNTEVNVVQRDDPSKENHVILDVNVNKKEKVKIQKISFYGNKALTEGQLEHAMKKTKDKGLKHFFRSKKFLEDKYGEDKVNIIKKYNEEGYRDAQITADSVYKNPDNTVSIKIWISEGDRYYFRNISWVGNTVYTSEYLSHILGIKKGDIFDQKLLNKRLREDDDAVSNLYLNHGYLFFNINPVETKVQNDSIDYEMRIYEGQQATINRIIISGNTKTHEHVARRELRTRPGQLFSKDNIIRSVRELAQLGHFNPETINPQVIPHPEDGTVDINYHLEERANDQIELSGGWGAGMFVGTVGLKFTNFSVRNIFNGKAWRPLPTGDGQTLSLRAQTNGSYYQSYSFSFIEPWLGGKKPNSFSLSVSYTKQTSGNSAYNYGGYNPYGYGSYGSGSYYGSSYGGYGGYSNMYDYQITQQMTMFGASVGLGRRLSWPDDYFTLYNEVSYQLFNLQNWDYFLFRNGASNILSFKTVLGRNSLDNPLYTRRGSNFSLSLQLTPPYSSFDGVNYADPNLSKSQRYKWIEYHKWKFKGDVYTPVSRNDKLILRTKFEAGFLGYYNKDRRSPFEQFKLGGDGMSGYSMVGSDVIGLRGYENNSLTPIGGGNLYEKFTVELHYPITLSQSATIYGLAFAEGGNSWYDFSDYNPFDIRRSAGLGVRIFLPMFGLMGFDWGYGFDDAYKANANGSQFHFIIGQQF